MKSMLLVAIGGAAGSLARYKLGGLVLQHTISWKLPAGTFVVNVLGCLAAGVLLGLAQRYDYLTPETRLFLFTGVLGGFTTFSAFGVETAALIQRGELAVAVSYVLFSVLCGLAALLGALKLVQP
jgi:CrcB protein